MGPQRRPPPRRLAQDAGGWVRGLRCVWNVTFSKHSCPPGKGQPHSLATASLEQTRVSCEKHRRVSPGLPGGTQGDRPDPEPLRLQIMRFRLLT